MATMLVISVADMVVGWWQGNQEHNGGTKETGCIESDCCRGKYEPAMKAGQML